MPWRQFEAKHKRITVKVCCLSSIVLPLLLLLILYLIYHLKSQRIGDEIAFFKKNITYVQSETMKPLMVSHQGDNEKRLYKILSLIQNNSLCLQKLALKNKSIDMTIYDSSLLDLIRFSETLKKNCHITLSSIKQIKADKKNLFHLHFVDSVRT